MPEDGNEYHLIDNEVDEGLGFSVSNTVEKMPHLDAIKKYKHANGLFMCYCPPDSDMGSTSLKAFRGEYVAIIGEDLMNTGDLEMFRVLDDQFKVTERVYLPQWMDTVHHLTIFKRRSLGRKRKKSVVQITNGVICVDATKGSSPTSRNTSKSIICDFCRRQKSAATCTKLLYCSKMYR